MRRIKFNNYNSLEEQYHRHLRANNILNHLRKYQWLYISIALMIVIFLLSHQPSDHSSVLSNRVTDFLSNVSNNSIRVEAVRKLAHFILFALLGSSIFTHLRYVKRFKHIIYYYLFAFIPTLLYAIIDEIHQYFVPGRATEILDIFIDCLGCFIALVINYIIITILQSRSKTKRE